MISPKCKVVQNTLKDAENMLKELQVDWDALLGRNFNPLLLTLELNSNTQIKKKFLDTKSKIEIILNRIIDNIPDITRSLGHFTNYRTINKQIIETINSSLSTVKELNKEIDFKKTVKSNDEIMAVCSLISELKFHFNQFLKLEPLSEKVSEIKKCIMILSKIDVKAIQIIPGLFEYKKIVDRNFKKTVELVNEKIFDFIFRNKFESLHYFQIICSLNSLSDFDAYFLKNFKEQLWFTLRNFSVTKMKNIFDNSFLISEKFRENFKKEKIVDFFGENLQSKFLNDFENINLIFQSFLIKMFKNEDVSFELNLNDQDIDYQGIYGSHPIIERFQGGFEGTILNDGETQYSIDSVISMMKEEINNRIIKDDQNKQSNHNRQSGHNKNINESNQNINESDQNGQSKQNGQSDQNGQSNHIKESKQNKNIKENNHIKESRQIDNNVDIAKYDCNTVGGVNYKDSELFWMKLIIVLEKSKKINFINIFKKIEEFNFESILSVAKTVKNLKNEVLEKHLRLQVFYFFIKEYGNMFKSEFIKTFKLFQILEYSELHCDFKKINLFSELRKKVWTGSLHKRTQKETTEQRIIRKFDEFWKWFDKNTKGSGFVVSVSELNGLLIEKYIGKGELMLKYDDAGVCIDILQSLKLLFSDFQEIDFLLTIFKDSIRNQFILDFFYFYDLSYRQGNYQLYLNKIYSASSNINRSKMKSVLDPDILLDSVTKYSIRNVYSLNCKNKKGLDEFIEILCILAEVLAEFGISYKFESLIKFFKDFEILNQSDRKYLNILKAKIVD